MSRLNDIVRTDDLTLDWSDDDAPRKELPLAAVLALGAASWLLLITLVASLI